jgi:enamine deaminase RidA (YjgF/YER057c/UK114 family)
MHEQPPDPSKKCPAIGEELMRKMLVPHEFSNIPDQWHFAPIVDTGEFVFLSGITGVHPDGSLSDEPQTQFRDTFRFVELHLETAGLHFDNVVEMTTYHVGLREHLNTFIKVKDEFVRIPYPAWTAIGIAELITEGTLLEIRVIARRERLGLLAMEKRL